MALAIPPLIAFSKSSIMLASVSNSSSIPVIFNVHFHENELTVLKFKGLR